METLERWLRSRPLVITLIFALVVSYCISADGVVADDAMPFGDGERYVMRCMTLYGYLHTGQWGQFWDVFTLPKQSIAPLHYWIFFLLPQSWASLTAYGVIQAVTTYILFAFAVWQLCRTLDRPEWTPAMFLLCATQNISIDFSFFYFADIPFMAMGTLALAWQIRAWKLGTLRSGILSGFGTGLLFWVKPPNAIIYAAIFVLAEIVRTVLVWRMTEAKAEPLPERARKLFNHTCAVALGFIPITSLALACGGFQSIIRLIDVNEVSDIFATTLECTGFTRLLYFPLCLTFFYHVILLAIVFTAAALVAFVLNVNQRPHTSAPETRSRFPALLLWPLIIAYLFLGEFFSFGEASKGMRSLLLVLPVMWLAIFWFLEYWRMRPGLVFCAAAAYVVCAYSQVFNDTFGTVDVPTEGYQLKGDWLARLPQPHFLGRTHADMTQVLIDALHDKLPEGGKVSVGSELIFLTSESLSWSLQHDLALKGERSPYQFENFLTNDGKFCRSALVDARGVLVYLHPSIQYSRDVVKASNDLVQFGIQGWLKDGTAQMIPLRNDRGDIWVCIMIFKDPVTDAQVTQIVRATKGTELPPYVEFNPPVDHHLSWQECWDVLVRWKLKRLGW